MIGDGVRETRELSTDGARQFVKSPGTERRQGLRNWAQSTCSWHFHLRILSFVGTSVAAHINLCPFG